MQVVNGEGEKKEKQLCNDPLSSFPMTKQPWTDSISALIPWVFCNLSSIPSFVVLSQCVCTGSAQTKAANTIHRLREEKRYRHTTENPNISRQDHCTHGRAQVKNLNNVTNMYLYDVKHPWFLEVNILVLKLLSK